MYYILVFSSNHIGGHPLLCVSRYARQCIHTHEMFEAQIAELTRLRTLYEALSD
jgi:hypothetical protein